VVFTGVLSVLFLRRRLQLFHWTGMALVMAGAFVVGVSALSSTDPDQPKASNPALGNMLIVRPCPCPACPRATRLPLLARGAWARLTPQARRGRGQVSAQLIVATQMVPACWSALTPPPPTPLTRPPPLQVLEEKFLSRYKVAPAPAPPSPSTFARTTPSLPAPKAFPERARSSPRRPRPSAPAGP
jgi:drug/metabolite transporter (DMT)-like permease